MTKSKQVLVASELPDDVSAICQDSESRNIELGQWFWLKSGRPQDHNDRGAPEGYHWIACVVHVGSNYVKLESPRHHGTNTVCHNAELLFSELHENAVFEANPSEIFEKNVSWNQSEVRKALGEITSLCQQLGVTPKQLQQTLNTSASTELVVLSQTREVDAYKQSLITAKTEALPALFEKVKQCNNNVAKWLGAESTSVKAQLSIFEDTLNDIDERVFNVSLYAGLEEQAVQIQSGEPAAANEKIHLMQRRLYMDEECLVDYDAGGMGFEEIEQFDQWLLRPANLNRILPNNKCVVAMRVRRSGKSYQTDGGIHETLINFNRRINDQLTYLYIRNGANVYRINTEIELQEMLFPDDVAVLTEPVMAKVSFGKVESIITQREYDMLVTEAEQLKAKYDNWNVENPNKRWVDNPYRHSATLSRFHQSEWYPADDTTTKYDLIQEHLEAKVKHYNHIVLILQGLLDRSEILHPHPAVHLHKQADFEQYIELVYDANRVLTFGEAPDFEQYRIDCNKKADKNSVFVGQHIAWMEREAERENVRREKSEYAGHLGMCNYYKPPGNPGPEKIGQAEKVMLRAKKARFSWQREAKHDFRMIPDSITVPFEKLLNVSAYKKGDYKRFFEDPRTRQEYLKWAPYLLAAEDYLASF